MIVFFNGHMMPENDAAVPVTDRGLCLGDGVFDTMLVLDGVPQHADDHFTRLHRHAAVLGLVIPHDVKTLRDTVQKLLAENEFTHGRHAVRTTVTRGPGLRGIAVPDTAQATVIMRASPVPTAPDRDTHVIIAQDVRRNEGSPLSRIKSLNYGDNIIAWQEARTQGADDALLLNNAGNLACATASNVFVNVNGEWLTPPLRDGAMDGVTRAQLLRDGFGREETITAVMLAAGGNLILTNAVMGQRPAKLLSPSSADSRASGA